VIVFYIIAAEVFNFTEEGKVFTVGNNALPHPRIKYGASSALSKPNISYTRVSLFGEGVNGGAMRAPH
jgi:hypothetical protein